MNLIDGQSAIIIISLHALLVLMTTFFAVIALLHNPKSVTNKALAALMGSIALWGMANLLIYFQQSIFWTRVALSTELSFAVIQTFATLFFIWVFPSDDMRPTKRQKWIIWGCGVALVVGIVISPVMFTFNPNHLYPGTFVEYSQPHLPYLPIWAGILLVAIVWGIVLAVKKYRRADKKDKGAFASVLYGAMGTGVILMVTQFFVVNIFNTITFNLYGPLFVTPLIFGTGYAIIKHRLFSIKVAATEILTLSLWILLAVRIFFEITTVDAIVDVVVLVVAVFIGFFLIKSVLNEEQQIEDLKKLDEAKSSFISIASHQLRTPLTSMKWFSEMLMDGDAGAITEDQKHFVENIYESANRMVELVNLLLQLARVEAGRLKIEPKATDLKELTEAVQATLKTDLDKKSQKFEIRVEPDPLPMIPLDQEIVWQVIQNLSTNAMRYSPAGKTILVNISVKGEFVQYSVKDEGIGIPEGERDRIFERFFRADNALKLVPEGSGLGLSLAKSLVEEWGGRTWFETELNKGTTFFFTIPVKGMAAREGEVKISV
jgi:signal transduction histidine kinase